MIRNDIYDNNLILIIDLSIILIRENFSRSIFLILFVNNDFDI